MILFGERSLRRALRHYVVHFHAERHQQGKGNFLLIPQDSSLPREGPVRLHGRFSAPPTLLHQDSGVRVACRFGFFTTGGWGQAIL